MKQFRWLFMIGSRGSKMAPVCWIKSWWMVGIGAGSNLIRANYKLKRFDNNKNSSAYPFSVPQKRHVRNSCGASRQKHQTIRLEFRDEAQFIHS